jgi:hypothetical protein
MPIRFRIHQNDADPTGSESIALVKTAGQEQNSQVRELRRCITKHLIQANCGKGLGREELHLLPKNVSYIDFRPNTPCSLAWLVAGRNTLGGRSLWYRTDCGTLQTVLLGGCLFSCTGPASCPADLQLYSKWGATGWGK